MYEKDIFVVTVITVDNCLSAFLYLSLNVLIVCFRVMGLEHVSVTSNLTNQKVYSVMREAQCDQWEEPINFHMLFFRVLFFRQI